ncbi:MAG TPA: hypothetical protein DC049_18915, partial [Spirochaetia bacterium]|nr:hypothetical protein [Spirochaetia bacterium]
SPVQYKSAVYAGKPENSSFLKRMQVRITDLPENAGVLIVDASENELDKKKKWLNDFVIRQGKTMLVLWPDENSDLSWLPGKIMAGKALERKEKIFKVILSAEEKQNKLLNGITSEDMYFKFFRDEIPLIRKAGSGKIMLSGLLAEIPAGQGKIIICQLNPDQHENERSFGKVYRFWANLFTSLSVALDSRLNLYWNGLEISQREWLFEIDPENAGIKTEWFQPAFNDNNWKRLKTGKSWESQGITSENPALPGPPHTSYNGNAWYRLHLDIPEKYLKSDLYLEIGAIAGEDTVWLNGSLIGTTSKKTAGSKNYYQAFRNYKNPSGLLRGKNNVIAVCVYNEGGFGGLTKWPVRISPADQPYDTVLFPLEKNRKQGDPYRYVMW